MNKWILIALTAASAAFGGFSPNQERAIQIQEILTSHEVTSTFPLGVNLVEKIDSGYLLRANESQMVVDVIPLQPDSMGRPQYKLRFHTVQNDGRKASGH